MEGNRDLIIVGGGCAGLAAAQYAARASLKALLVEELAPGGQALLIDNLENYPGFPEPLSGYDFSEKMRAQAESFGAEILGASVVAVSRAGDEFTVETSVGTYKSPALIVATGAAHRKLGAPGEEELAGRGVSYCATCDGPFFRGKPMLVVGGGDAACDESMFLAKLASKVILVHRRDKLRAQGAVAARALSNPKIEARLGTVVREIRGQGKVGSVVLEELATGRTYEEEVAAVFIFIGSEPRTRLFAEPEKDAEGYIITDQRMESSVPGLFAAGDVRASPFRQLVVAAAEGAIAAHSAAQRVDEVRSR